MTVSQTPTPPPDARWKAHVAGLRQTARTAVDELRESFDSARAMSVAPPARHRRMRRFGYGLALPFTLLLMTLRDPKTRRAYLRTALPTALITLALSVAAVASPWTRDQFFKEERAETTGRKRAKRERLSSPAPGQPALAAAKLPVPPPPSPLELDGAKASHASPSPVAPPPPRAPATPTRKDAASDEPNGVDEDGAANEDNSADEDDEKSAAGTAEDEAKLAPASSRDDQAEDDKPEVESAERAEVDAALDQANAALLELGDKVRGPDGKRPGEQTTREVIAKLRETAKAQTAGAKSSAQQRAVAKRLERQAAALERRLAARQVERETERADEAEAAQAEPPPPPKRSLSWSSLLALYAALNFVEWWVLALSRDFQNQLSRSVALTSGAVPEDPDLRPRVRVDVRHLWKKLKRKTRGFLLIGSAGVAFYFIRLIPVVGTWTAQVLVPIWTFYWLSVFALGASAAAWTVETPGDPWFVRTFLWFGKVPVVGLLPVGYARVWRRLSRSVRSPCEVWERASWEGMGLAVARRLCVPVLYTFVRPVFSVAAQHAVRAHLTPEAPALPVTTTTPSPLPIVPVEQPRMTGAA